MIDPEKLAAQRIALGVITVPVVRKKSGPAHACACGVCRLCRKRAWMRAFRAGLPKGPPKKMGPKMELGRRCKCGEPISDKNTTGFCQLCHRNWKRMAIATAEAA